MEFLEALKRRTSVRDFTDKPIDAETLREIVEDAQKSPSWTNSQPWKVYIATGDTLKDLQKDHKYLSDNGVQGSPDFPVPDKSPEGWGKLSHKNIMSWIGEIRNDPAMGDLMGANSRLWNAPAIAYITIPRSAPVWSIFDAGSFAHLLMLAAASRKIDTMIAYSNIKYSNEIRTRMDIPDDEAIIAGIALGYRGEDKINSYRSPRSVAEGILKIM